RGLGALGPRGRRPRAFCATVATPPETRAGRLLAMKLLFVADPLESFKTYKDTTYAMMRAAQARGHAIHACEARELQWARGGHVGARVREIALVDLPADADPHAHHDWFAVLHDSGVRAP